MRDSDLESAADHVRGALARAARGLVEREALVELIALAAVAREHLLVIGPPGTGKSEAVRRVARALGGVYFEYLLGRFTEPTEIFGPVNLSKLREGTVETEIAGMLPEAEIAFLDEIFLGSTAILNTLLGILNERRFRRGHTDVACPLRVAVGASNRLPEDESLAAFADRFLLRTFVDPIPDPLLEELLVGGALLEAEDELRIASIAEVDILMAAARSVDVAPVRSRLAYAVRLLRSAGISLSDRRIIRVQRLIAAAAALAGRRVSTTADLWPLVYAVPTAEEQHAARDTLRELLAPSDNPALGVAAAEASLGPLARSRRLTAMARELLGEEPPAGRDDLVTAWRLRLEGVAREIDAGFSPAALPEELAEVRRRIVELLSKGEECPPPPSP